MLMHFPRKVLCFRPWNTLQLHVTLATCGQTQRHFTNVSDQTYQQTMLCNTLNTMNTHHKKTKNTRDVTGSLGNRWCLTPEKHFDSFRKKYIKYSKERPKLTVQLCPVFK